MMAIAWRFAAAWNLRVTGPGTVSAALGVEELSHPASEHSGRTTTSHVARADSSTNRNSSARLAFLSPMVTRTCPNPTRRLLRAMAASVAFAVPPGQHRDPRHLEADRVKEYPVIIAT